jgi:hypothetical protein
VRVHGNFMGLGSMKIDFKVHHYIMVDPLQAASTLGTGLKFIGTG